MKKTIYFDNACTSYPKPETVPEAMINYITSLGSNINRGCYDIAYKTEELVFETRELINELFKGEDSANVVFTKNITESLNFILKGLLNPGDHVLVSAMEHNAVMRPLVQLTQNHITFDRIPCSEDGSMVPSDLLPLIRPNTKAVIMLHASNVCGTLLPIKVVGQLCSENNLLFIVDSAQTAGVFDIDMAAMNIDALCFTGHKSLLGPQGIGGFIIKNHMINKLNPLISGGTGSISHTEAIPEFMPDRFEAGTPNIPGILGLNASLKWLLNKGIANIRAHKMDLTEHMLKELILLEDFTGKIKLIGRRDISSRAGVISIAAASDELSAISYELEQEFGILTRVGLHCAPSAHKTLNTFPTGTIRFSFGPENTHDEIDYAIKSLKTILQHHSQIS